MIGFYDYTVVVTYISLISSIIGIFMAIEGRMQLAVFCLAFSGLCDMFDGKIARTKRTVPKMRSLLGFRSTLSATLSVLGSFLLYWGTSLECVMCTVF